jgi:Acetyltransferase (GNAT) domain
VESYTFHEGIPEGLTFHLDLGIFHNPKHLLLQTPIGWNTFYIRKVLAVEGIVHFNLNASEALSPYRSPFGSFLFSDIVNESTLRDFIHYCHEKLLAKKVEYVQIKNQPERYKSNRNQLLETLLRSEGYAIDTEETSAIISVSDQSFESGLHRSEKKRLRKCRESGLTFELASFEKLREIYVFLEACRKDKGYSLSMSLAEMDKLVDVFRDRVLLTKVLDQGRIVAANISLRVYDDVLYNFYHDHTANYDHLSPVVLLNEGLYQFCHKENIKLLDLGTSNLNGKVNESLLEFKLRLGAEPSRKLTFIKRFS